MHMFCAAMGLTYRLLPAAYATTLWAGGLFVYYMLTSFGEPEHTGGSFGALGSCERQEVMLDQRSTALSASWRAG